MKRVFILMALAALSMMAFPGKSAAAGTNLVPNPSFEMGTTSPTSWSKITGSSRNSTTFTYPVAGYDLAKAARVSVTSYRSGTIGWSSSSFPVVAGSQYDLTDYSLSSVSSTVLAVYTTTAGGSTTVTLGTVTGTKVWKPFTQTITIPAGVTTMSLEHGLQQTGTLDVDAFSLTLHGTVVPPVVPPSGNNLITNGNFETAATGNTAQPLGWTPGYWGTLTPVFTYPVPGKTGQGAKVQVTSYSSGDAKWVFMPVATSGGKTYSIQFDYTSTVPTNISIEYHLTNGSYSYGWLGDPAASSTWTTFTGQFTAPAGSDSFTVFQALVSTGTLTIDNYVATDITNGALSFPSGMITLDFDDTYASQFTVARPILNAAGIKASFYAITDPSVGIGSDPSYMTWANIATLKADGHEIGAHTRTHPDLSTLTLAQAQAEIVGSKNDLIAHGITPTTFVYPYGVYNANIEQLVKSAGFVSARSVGDGFNYPSSNKLALLDKHIESTTTIANVQSWITQAIANKTWLILELHEQTSTPGPDTGVYYNTPTMMQNIVNAIKASGIKTVTQAQGTALMNP